MTLAPPALPEDAPSKWAARCAMALIGIVLVAGAAALPGHLAELRRNLPLLRLWFDPDQQHRLALGPAYDFLRAADAALPADASVLLVTSGRDVRHREYTTFHRALYFLTPRPVWWVTPAPSDSTWESRWWITASLTRAAILAIAEEKNVSHILTFELAGPSPAGDKVTDLPGGALFALEAGQESMVGSPPPVRVASLWPVRICAALLVILMIGSCAVGILRRCSLRPTKLEAMTLAWALGAGLTSIALLWLNALGMTLDRQRTVLTLAAIGGFAATRRFGHRRENPSPPIGDRSRVWALPSILLYAFLATLILTVTVSAVGRPLTTWDSWVLWGMRARAMFVEGRISPVIYADPSRAVTHLDYPLLFPSLEAWIYAWLGAEDDRLAGIVSVLFYVALPAVAYSALARRGTDRSAALLASVALAAVPVLVGLAGDVLADVPVALFAAVAAIYLIEWLEGGRSGRLIVAALAAAFLAWTKREGAVLAAALAVATLIVGRASGRARWGALAVAAAAAASAPWYAYVASHGISDARYPAPSAAGLVANLGRLPSIAGRALATSLSSDQSWVWPLCVLFALLHRRGIAPIRPTAIFPLSAILYLGALSITYLFSAYVPYQQHVASSFFRLAAHVVPLPLLWIAYHATPRS